MNEVPLKSTLALKRQMIRLSESIEDRKLRAARLSLELSDTKVFAPSIRALFGATSHFCEVVVLTLRSERHRGL